LKKERDESTKIKDTLDGKLSLALAKAELVPALEIEKDEIGKKVDS